MKTLCIYHANCSDGFAAAAVVYRALGKDNVEFCPGVYSESSPEVHGRDVVIVDFSYKRDTLIEMASDAKSITIIDHHKTAKEELVDLPSNVKTIFDMSQSGSMLTWKYYFFPKHPPQLFWHIQDRDLWQWQLGYTKEITAALSAYEYDLELWDSLMKRDINELIVEGRVISRYTQKVINELIATGSHETILDGHTVPALNVPYMFASDAGHILCEGREFSMTYWYVGGRKNVSLRSDENGLDVADVAKKFGGGGHPHAAGFSYQEGRYRIDL